MGEVGVAGVVVVAGLLLLLLLVGVLLDELYDCCSRSRSKCLAAVGKNFMLHLQFKQHSVSFYCTFTHTTIHTYTHMPMRAFGDSATESGLESQ